MTFEKTFRLTLVTFILLMNCSVNGQHVIKVPLQKVEGRMPFLYLSSSTKKVDYPVNGVPKDVKDYIIKEMRVIPSHAQGKYESYQAGKITAEEYIRLFPNCIKYTKDLSQIGNLKRKVTLLVGNDKAGQRIVIVDALNDGDLSNDVVLTYQMDLPGITRNGSQYVMDENLRNHRDSLPNVKIELEDFDGEKVTAHQLLVKPDPYNTGFTYPNPEEQNFHVAVMLWEYRVGKVTLDGKNYKIAVENTFSSPVYREDAKPQFLISLDYANQDEWDKPKESSKGEPFLLGDIATINGTKYELTSITQYGDTLTLTRKPGDEKTMGYYQDAYAPEIALKDINGILYTSNKTKYTLLDFWGTWCSPCIEAIPRLKELRNKYSDLEVVSIAYEDEKDIDKLKKMIESRQMNWKHLVQLKSDDSPNSLIQQFNIDTYPTTILINKEGRIIFTGHGTKELENLDALLESELNKKP